MFEDTIGNFVFSEKNYFKLKGKYTISIAFVTEDHGKDSIDYDFEMSGAEIITDISVGFDFRERLIKKGDIFIKGEKVINDYIRLNKYYKALKSIDIALDKENLGDEKSLLLQAYPFYSADSGAAASPFGGWAISVSLPIDVAVWTASPVSKYRSICRNDVCAQSRRAANVMLEACQLFA